MAGLRAGFSPACAMLLALLAAPQAQADTWKCRDAAGHITYSQTPCKGAGSRVEPATPSQTRRGKERTLGACPSRDDLRSMEEAAKVLAKPDFAAEQALMQAELARAKACRFPGAPYRAFDWKELVSLYPELSFSDPAVRTAARERIARIHETVAARRAKPRAAAPAAAK